MVFDGDESWFSTVLHFPKCDQLELTVGSARLGSARFETS